MNAKSDLQAASTTMASSSVLSADTTILCPPQAGNASSGCSLTPTKLVPTATIAGGATASQLPANYANASTTGTPLEVAVFGVGAGIKQLDPYGHYYIVCRWEHTVASGGAIALLFISAGPDGILQTKCGDSSAQGDDTILSMSVGQIIQRSSVWAATLDANGNSTDVHFGQVGTQLNVDYAGNLTVPGTLGVTGTSTLATVNAGTLSAASESVTGVLSATGGLNAGSSSQFTVSSGGNISTSGTLAVTGSSSLGTVSAGNGSFSGTLSSGGNATFNSEQVTGVATVGGTFGVTGATTLSSTLGVTGASTLTGGINAGSSNQFTVNGSGNVATSGTLTSGAATLASAAVTGNQTIGGTLGVTGLLSGSTATFTGTVTAANFSGTISGNSTNVTGVVAIANGGTGASDATTARSNLGTNDAGNLTTGTLSASLLASNSIPGSDIQNNTITSTQLNTTGVTAGAYSWGTVGADGRLTFAQNISANTFDDGTGEKITATQVSGKGYLTFYTNSVANMILDNNGYLGIGTTSPNQRLDLVGNVRIEGASGTSRDIQYTTGSSSKRWVVSTNGTAEGGSNAGSDYVIQNYDDTGTVFGSTPLKITRSTGNAVFSGTVTAPTFYGNLVGNVSGGTISGGVTFGTSTAATNPQISGDLTTGFYSAGAGLVDLSISGTKLIEWSSTNENLTGSLSATKTLSTGANGGTGGQVTLNGATSGSVALKVAAAAGTSTVFQLPSTNGTNGYVLQSDGTGVTSWVSPGSGATITLGTSAAAANPQKSGDATTGFYSDATGIVEVATSGADAMSWNPLTGAVDYISITPGKSGTPPLLAISGTTTNQGLNITPAGTGTVAITNGQFSVGTNGSAGGQVTLNGATSGSVALKVAAAAGTSTVFQLPSTNGTNGYVLQTDGTGITSWAASASGSTLGTSTSAVSPQRSGDATTGFYTSGANTVNVASGGVEVEQWNTLASGVDYLSITPGKSGTTPTLAIAGTTTNQGLNISPAGTGTVTVTNGKFNVGTSGSSTAAVGLTGATGGTVTLQPQASFTSYNFNLPTSAGTSGQPLLSGGGSSTAMTFGTLGVAAGGTGQTTLTAHGVLLGNGTSAVTQLAAAASNTILTGQGSSADPSFSATPTLGTNGGTGGQVTLNGATSGSLALKVAAAAGTSTVFQLPSTNGTNGYFLKTDGTGVTSWAAASGASTFTSLTDAPNSYSGSGGYYVTVNAGATALTFSNALVAQNVSGLSAPTTMVFDDLSDISAASPVTADTIVYTGSTWSKTSAATGALLLPIGTTGQRPTSTNGMMRYSSTSNLFEFYQNGSWVNYTTTSDRRLKTDIKPLLSALDTALKLNPITFKWDPKNPRNAGRDENTHMGFIAQELEKVIPDVVSVGADTYRTVRYDQIVTVAIGAVKELKQENDELRNDVERLQKDQVSLNKDLENLRAKVEKVNPSEGLETRDNSDQWSVIITLFAFLAGFVIAFSFLDFRKKGR